MFFYNNLLYLIFGNYSWIYLPVLALIPYIIFTIKRNLNLPPGPWGLPIVGYLPFMNKERLEIFGDLAQKYGPVFSLKMGNQLVVVLSDHKVIRNAFRMNEFTGRPHTPLGGILDGLGIVCSEGTLWKKQRAFLHDELRRLGMTFLSNGRGVMEPRIMSEVVELVKDLEELNGHPLDLDVVLARHVNNIVNQVTMSLRFEKGDKQFEQFNRNVNEGMRLYGQVFWAEYVPLYLNLPGKTHVIEKIKENRKRMSLFMREKIYERKRMAEPEEINDLLDAYLREIRSMTTARRLELFQGRDEEEQMVQVFMDFFSAGMETVKTTILWCMVYLMHHPDIQERMQEEVDEVVGYDRLPCLEDMPQCPYIEATILEILRIATIVPLGTTHAATKDVELNGYTIPKGAQVIPFIYSVHKDPNLWENPEIFDPSRFITEEGNIRRPECFMPFGVGRRMCFGDILARMELFLFVCSLIQNFNIVCQPGRPMPSLKGLVGTTHSPLNFDISFIPRKHRKSVLRSDMMTLRKVGSN